MFKKIEVVDFKIDEFLKQYKGFKPFDTIGKERTLEIVCMAKNDIEKRLFDVDPVSMGIHHILYYMVCDGLINIDESEQVLYTLYHYGVQHGKISKDIDPKIMHFFDPCVFTELISYLEYFIDNFGKEVSHEATKN